ncbi:MAG: hypothetical protein PHW58_04465 [Candidatus Methanofastidiosa archaeon]|jgi:hypothetical protein|nr:hypothetical protein [Candidatus Methanofastidiosa archaeon]MDD4281467.1 hypothetical protein [Candidatus Methanofastidiosa archaeon]
MQIYNRDIRIRYLPLYVAVPIMAGIAIAAGYLFWWLINGTWPAILFLMAAVMMFVETWERTRAEKGKILSVRKVDPL